MLGAAQQKPADPKDPRVGLKPGLRTPASPRATWSWSRTCRGPKGSSIRRPPAAMPMPPEPPAGEKPAPEGGRCRPTRCQHRAAPAPRPRTPARSRAGAPSAPLPRRRLRGAAASTSRTPTSPSPAPTCGSATSTASTPTTSRTRASRKLLASIACPGGQGDVSVHGQPAVHVGGADARPHRLRPAGRRRDRQQGALPRRPHLRHHRPAEAAAGGGGADLPRLAHAHARDRPERQGATSTSTARAPAPCASGEELEGCSGLEPEKDRNTALFSIDVIEVPLAAPQTAKIVNRPRIFADEDRQHRRPVEGRRSRPGHAAHAARPTSATTSRCSPRSASPRARARATAS